jgi:hypothetical protein
MLEEQIEIPRIGGQEFPKIVALGKRRGLSGAAIARHLRILIFCSKNLDLERDRSYLPRAPGEIPDGQRTLYLGAARQENGAG